jgi:hypothetical protein
MREVLQYVVYAAAFDGKFEDVISKITDTIFEMMTFRVPIEKLIIIRSIGGNYKSDSYFMKVFGDQLKKAEKPVQAGDRLEYVVVEARNTDEALLGYRMRLIEQLTEGYEAGTPEHIDRIYYVDKVLKNPITNMISVCYIKEFKEVSDKRQTVEKEVDRISKMSVKSFYELDLTNPVTKQAYLRILELKLKLGLKKWCNKFYQKLEIVNEFKPKRSRIFTGISKDLIDNMVKLINFKETYLHEFKTHLSFMRYRRCFKIPFPQVTIVIEDE